MSAKLYIKRYFFNKWQQIWSGLTTNSKLRAVHPLVCLWPSNFNRGRRVDIIISRLRIGHTHYTHKFLMENERRAPQCISCDCDITVHHILVDCPRYVPQRRSCSLDGKAIEEILGEGVEVENILKFLKQIDLFFEI